MWQTCCTRKQFLKIRLFFRRQKIWEDTFWLRWVLLSFVVNVCCPVRSVEACSCLQSAVCSDFVDFGVLCILECKISTVGASFKIFFSYVGSTSKVSQPLDNFIFFRFKSGQTAIKLRQRPRVDSVRHRRGSRHGSIGPILLDAISFYKRHSGPQSFSTHSVT